MGGRRSNRRRDEEALSKWTSNIAVFGLASAALAVLFSFTVTVEQALLAAALPSACVWALKELPETSEESPCPGSPWAICILAIIAMVIAMERKETSSCVLPVCALASLAANSTRLPLILPAASFVPYSALTVFILALTLGGEEVRTAAGLTFGEDVPVPWVAATASAVISSALLVAWSLFWVRGAHGRIQDARGPTMTPLKIVLFSIINGIGEELEFRMLIFGGLIARPAKHPICWLVTAVLLQAAFFALLHYAGGFPSGVSGTMLLFVWAIFLGALRLWTGSIVLPILLHIEIDIVVFTLLLLEHRRRTQHEERGNATPDEKEPSLGIDGKIAPDAAKSGETASSVFGQSAEEYRYKKAFECD